MEKRRDRTTRKDSKTHRASSPIELLQQAIRIKREEEKMQKIIIISIVGLLAGCATSEPKSDIRLHDLLHKDCNYVYKSVTIKDYIIKEEC
jgi:hypothetical protein